MTRRAFVIGHPVKHSRSPLIHMNWIAEHGLDANYEAIDIDPRDLPGFLDRIRSGEFVGGNVTVPLKERAFSLCDDLDPEIEIIGATNTLILHQDAKGDRPVVYGTNTDGYGFAANLDDHAEGWAPATRSAIVLGAGGAARAILLALSQRGVPNIHLLNRTAERAVMLADELAMGLDVEIEPGGLGDFAERAPTGDLVINTTTIGMDGTAFSDLPLQRLKPSALVTDLVYTPLVTPLLSQARDLGLKTVDGLGMLLHQAVPGFEAWFGVRPEVTADLRRKVEQSLELQ